MAKISELADGGNLLNDDELIVLRAGGNVRATVANLPEVDASGNQSFADNEKAIFGTGSDLQIYHSGTNSFIQEQGTGDLYITTNGSKIDMMTNGLTEYGVRIFQDGEVSLYHNGLAKLATTSTGIDVTGSVTADALTVGGTLGNFDISTGGNQATFDYNGFNYINFSGSGAVLAVRRTGSLTTTSWSSNGDINLGYEDTGTTAKLFWDASAESLGIGTSSPATQLEVASGSGNTDGATNSPTLRITNQTDSADWDIGDVVGTLEFYADDSSGNAPYDTSFIKSVNEQNNGTLPSGALTFGTATYNAVGGAVERMRIDSSGNLLVGKTVASSSTNGAELKNGTGVSAIIGTSSQSNAASGNVMILNRRTTDGEIVDFRKDGSPVGSIGAAGSRVYISGPNASLHSGLIFTDNGSEGIIAPSTKAGAIANGTTDLGYSGGRFKDGHFSGNINANTFTAVDGVYIGGVGFANKLDDYEEGTWTPTLTGNTTAGSYTVTPTGCRYTKIGRLVTVTGKLAISVTSSGTGTARFSGLPFITDALSTGQGAVRVHNINTSSGMTITVTSWTSNSADFALSVSNSNAGVTNVQATDIGSASIIEMTFQYETAA